MKYYLYLFIFIFIACKDEKQEAKDELPPYWNDIQEFRKQDSLNPPPKNAILFIGSSSFTLWKDVLDYFPGYTIINRGFGGSTLADQIRYANDIIFPYHPRQIVIYCGENDLAIDSVSATTVFERFKQLFQMIGEKTDVPIAYVSMKPSPSRRHLIQKMREGNTLIRDFITFHNSSLDSRLPSAFIDIHQKMLNEQGEPMPEIFLDDSLHMNEKGYAIWKTVIEPYLIK